MHNSVKLLLILPILLVCGCGNAIKIKTEKSEYHTDTASASFELPQFEYEENQTFADDATAEFAAEAALILEDFLAKELPELEADTKIMRNDGRIVSLILEGEIETKMAHAEKFRRARTYDFLLGKSVSLNDLFSDDSWYQMADNKMRELAEADEGDYSDLWEMPTVERLLEENFYIKEGSLIIFYPPYELSYYRRGYVEFEFDKEELSGYLSDYGREIL